MYFFKLYFLFVILPKWRQKSKFITYLSANIDFLGHFLAKQFLIASVWTLSWIFSLPYWIIFVKILLNFLKMLISRWNLPFFWRKQISAHESPQNSEQKPLEILENYVVRLISVIKFFFSNKFRHHRYFRIIH